jgi:hypothetical protein
MTRTRIALISSTAIASILGAALPAFAQAPAPAPMYAPSGPATMMVPAPAPGTEVAVVPVAPVVMPRLADDMTGSVGFGAGVGTGAAATSLVNLDTSTVFMKYWMSDAMAIIPQLQLTITKTKDVDAGWIFAPQVLADFTLLKGASTRLSAGLGLGITLAKNLAGLTTTPDTYIAFRIPVIVGVEHFFARWFSMGLGTSFNFLQYVKDGSAPWTMTVDVSNVAYLGYLAFYTD